MVSPGQTGEHDDVVDTRCEEHQQHTHQQDLIVGDDSAQAEDHDGYHEEVEHEHGAEEADVPGGLPQSCEGDPQEGRIQQHHQHGVDGRLGHRCYLWQCQAHDDSCEDRHQVQGDLVAIPPVDYR